jgi:hypothetical protein
LKYIECRTLQSATNEGAATTESRAAVTSEYMNIYIYIHYVYIIEVKYIIIKKQYNIFSYKECPQSTLPDIAFFHIFVEKQKQGLISFVYFYKIL